MSNVYLGTSSWNFSEWRGIFYPEGLAASQQLSYYVGHFNSVEVNTSFYALPRPATLMGWLESVPSSFTFALKFPRAISHDKRLVDCTSETLAFLDALRSLGDAAGPGFLQLPPDFSRARDGRTLVTYIEWLATVAQDLRIAVEVRAPDLITTAFASFLAERKMAFVLVDRPGVPDLATEWLELVAQGKAPHFAFIRWIGDSPKGPWSDSSQRNRERVAPQDDRLALWAQRITTLWQAGIDLFGYMHNPYEGYSPESVRRLQAHLAQSIVQPEWPPADWNSASSGQLSLFGG